MEHRIVLRFLWKECCIRMWATFMSLRLGIKSVGGDGVQKIFKKIGVLEKVRNFFDIQKLWGFQGRLSGLESRLNYFIFLDTGSFCNKFNNSAIFLCHIKQILVDGIFWKIKADNPSASFTSSHILINFWFSN